MNNHLPADDLQIRPASLADIPTIQKIVYTTWPVAYGNILSAAQISYMLDLLYNAKTLHEQIMNDHYYFLALEKYMAVGFAACSKVGEQIYKLQKLYVLPGTQKKGTGKALLQKIEEVAKVNGATKLQLNVNRMNVAKSFYERDGFTIVREEDIDIGNDYFMNDYVMEKEL